MIGKTGLRRALAVCAACATFAAAAAPPARPRPARRERIELRVTFRPWESAGTFRLETAAGWTDQGAARDLGAFTTTGGGVRRVLEGAQGTLVLWLEGAPRPGQPPLVGRWTVTAATGAYTGLTGGGSFTGMSGGDRRGASPNELQVLVGHVVHRW